MAKVKVTISLSPRILEQVDGEAKGDSRSAVIERLLRSALLTQAWTDYARDLSAEELELIHETAGESEDATALALRADDT